MAAVRKKAVTAVSFILCTGWVVDDRMACRFVLSICGSQNGRSREQRALFNYIVLIRLNKLFNT